MEAGILLALGGNELTSILLTGSPVSFKCLVHIYIYLVKSYLSMYLSVYLSKYMHVYKYKYKYIYICVFKIYILFHCIHITYPIEVNSAGTISSRFDKAAEDNEAGKESARDLLTVVLVMSILIISIIISTKNHHTSNNNKRE